MKSFRAWLSLICSISLLPLGAHSATQNLNTRAVAAGTGHSLVLRSDGTVWAFGTSTNGALGLGSLSASYQPSQIAGLSGVVGISVSPSHSLAVDSQGYVWAWGTNNYGQLGTGNTLSTNRPTRMADVTNAIAVSAGHFHSLVLLANGHVMACGSGQNACLGNGAWTNSYKPVQTSIDLDVAEISAGANHSVARTSDGRVLVWGMNQANQLGRPNAPYENWPALISSLSGVAGIAAGDKHTLAVLTNGQVYAWGTNHYGQLGIPGIGTTNAPTVVPNLPSIGQVSASIATSSALTYDGRIMVWGQNVLTNVDCPTNITQPIILACDQFFGRISAGNGYFLATGGDGSVWGRGARDRGQLGDGFASQLYFPGYDTQHPRFRFSPYAMPMAGRMDRGEEGEYPFTSRVVPLDFEQGVLLPAVGTELYCYPERTPWFLRISKLTLQHVQDAKNGFVTRFPVENPLVAFGREGGASRLYAGQEYSFGVYAGLFDETQAETNLIRISAYARSSLSGSETNVSPTATWTIGLPKRFSGTNWVNFASAGLCVVNETNGLRTRVEFVDGPTNAKPWGIDWIRVTNSSPPLIATNAVLAGIRLSHTASGTNLLYRIEVKGRVQTDTNAPNTLVPFATDSNGDWAAMPLYTMDFDTRPAWREHFLDTPHFAGLPLPPEYAGRTAKELQGMMATPTAAFALTDSAYTNLNSSPELVSHPLLDRLVDDLGRDPINLANYVVNEIGLYDPLMLGETNQTTVRGAVSAPGIKRSALGVLLEGQGSPTEQCALLVYLLRKSGTPAGYAFPTSDNLRLLDTTLARLWRIQVKGVTYANGIPVLTNALVLADYPWVVANIGTNTVHVFPWLKDYEIVEGANLYDFMPSAFDNAFKWAKAYSLGNSEILSLAPSDNVPSVLWPKFIEKVLRTNSIDPRITLDDLGVRAFNRRHHFPTWAHFPKPNYLTNQAQITVVPTLTTSTNTNTFLANIMEKIRVNVYRSAVESTNLLLSTGDWLACDLNNRKLLIYPDATNSLGLWLAPRNPTSTNIGNFSASGGYSAHPQSTSTTNISTNDTIIVQVRYTRRSAGLSSWGSYFPVAEFTAVTNQLSCRAGDVAGVCLSMGAVTPLMVQMHSEDYWALERTRLANTNFVPLIRDNEGSAAMLLGMGYFEEISRFQKQNNLLHKLTGVSWFGAGLGVVGKGGSDGRVQAKVDMHFSEVLTVGNASLHPETGDSMSAVVENADTMFIAGGSALEHRIITTTFQDQDAISTVRLLQLAAQRATNGVAGPIELNSRNYAALGDATYSGYGTNKLKDHDTNLWQSVVTAFSGWDADYGRVLITPGPITNTTGSYKGMGALILTASAKSAAISGNMAVLNGGWGGLIRSFKAIVSLGPNLAYKLIVTGAGVVTFVYNDIAEPTVRAVISSSEAVNLGTSAQSPLVPTPQQVVTASASAPVFNRPPGDVPGAIRQVKQTGWLGGLWAGMRSSLEMVVDPVSVVSGSFYVDTVDLTLPGPFPLELRRNYNSHSLADDLFGYGWKMNFMPYLVVVPNGTNAPLLHAADPDGAVICYRPVSASLWTVTAADNPTLCNNGTFGIGGTANAFNGRIEKNSTNNSYVLFGPDGSKRTFLETSYSITSGSNQLTRQRPYLTRWEDHAGNYHSFYYGTDPSQNSYGQLDRIQSANGNSLVFKYDFFGRVTDAFTQDGRRVSYTYDAFGDLVEVSLPDASVWKYEYEKYSFTATNSVTYTDSHHLLVREIKPDGRILENAYDSLRRVITQAASVGKSGVLITNATFTYSNDFTNITSSPVTGSTTVKDAFQNPTVHYYENSLIGRIVDPLAHEIVQDWFQASETNKTGYYPRSLESTTDKRGLIKQFQYDARGNITALTLKGNLTGNGSFNETATNTAVFTAQNTLQSLTDPVGRTTLFYYNDPADLYKVTSIVRLASGTAIATNTLSYTNVAEVITVGGTTRTNQVFGLKSAEVRADSSTNRWTYTSRGFPASFTRSARTPGDPSNTDPDVTITFAYNARGQMYEQSDSAGRTSRFEFDAAGRVLWREMSDESGSVVSREHYYYNRNGELEWYDGPAYDPEDYVHYEYDGAGRKIEETHWQAGARSDGSGVEAKAGDALYSTTFFDYDWFGNLVGVIDPRGVVTTNRYDAIGQLLSREVLRADGTVLKSEQFAYEPGGLVNAHTNPLGGLTRTGFTSSGQPCIATNVDGSISQWRYDLAGRTITEVLRNGSYWQTVYDDANRRITKIFKDSGNTALATNMSEFDRRGNIVRTVDAAGNGFTNIFDGLDRLRASIGPKVAYEPGPNAPPIPGGAPPAVQHVSTTYYDAAGLVTTNVNAFNESVISTRDVLGRQTKLEIKNSAAQTVRVTTTAYFPNHHGAAITEGTGSDAVTRYALTDNQNRTVLTIGVPSQFLTEYSINDLDAVGNVLSASRYANNRGVITRWQVQTNSFDELNRVSVRCEKDNATTTFAYDALGNVTNRTNPGGVKWQAAYNTAGQMLRNWNLGTNSAMVRSNNFTYYSSGNWKGLLATSTDARGVTCTVTYDPWLRASTKAYSGSSSEQQLTNTFAFDARGFLTNLVEQFASGGTGPTVTLARSYDAYGNVQSESTLIGGTIHAAASQLWDSAGRRQNVAMSARSLSFGWRADGLLASVSSDLGVDGAYGYTTAGLLNSRTVDALAMSVTSRDGVGRILGRTTTVNGSNRLVESLSWTDDGLLSSETLARTGGPSDGNFTDARSYAYAPLSRRLTEEKLNISASVNWTTQFQYDKGIAGGPGILTSIADPQSGGASWTADVDEFRRVKQETNNVVRRFAHGRVNGSNQIATVSVFLDSKPLPVTTVGTSQTNWPVQWWAQLELLPGTHTLQGRATHASGAFVTNTTITFTNNAIDQTTLSYFSEGQLTQRVWKSSAGVTNRTQNLIWDGKSRLMRITERDASTNGYDWAATYDALGRRLRTTTVRVVNGTNLTSQPTITKSYFDPEVEFLELGVSVNGKTTWKLYGPDADGHYGGLNGVGGLDAMVQDPGTVFLPIVDVLGNVLGHRDVTHGTNGWHSARATGFGSVPEFRPLSLGESPDLSSSVAWRGRWPDLSGFYWMGARYFDPVAGRFISCDPLGHDADPSLYAFCGGDPINRFDADGRFGKEAWAYGTGFAEGAAQGLGNEFVGVGKLVYGSTVGLGEQISLTGMDIAEANYGGTDFQSAIFQGAYDMSLDGATTGDIATEAALQASGVRFGNQIYDSVVVGAETGDYSQFSQNMGAVAGIAGGAKLIQVAGGVDIRIPGIAPIAETTVPQNVFWSGGRVAEDAARTFANANNGVIIGDTAAGRSLSQATQGLPWSQARPQWLSLSQDFARSASGEVNVFQNGRGISLDSIWRNEHQILRQNPNVTTINYHVVMPDGSVVRVP